MINIRTVFLILMPLILVSNVCIGQNVTHSPYSFYGVGEPHQRAFTQHRGMGGTGFSLAAPGALQLQNPATFAMVGYPVFQADYINENWKINNGTSSIAPRNGFINGGAFSVPLGKRMGMAFGLTPYSRMGYKITSTGNTTGVGDYNIIYEGLGGLNIFSAGVGGVLVKEEQHHLSAGANFLYIFGYTTHARDVNQFVEDATMTNATSLNKTNMRNPGAEFSMRYAYKYGDKHQASLSVGYTPELQLRALAVEQAYTYKTTSASKILKDTILFTETSGTTVLPAVMRTGISLSFNERFWINADFHHTAWSRLEILGTNSGLKDAQSIHVGLQVQPDPTELKSYLKIMQYRAGVRHTISPVDIGGQIAETAFSAGLGLPLMPSKTRTMAQIGIEFGNRGTAGNGQVQETLTTLFFGMTFMPFKTDQWFVRRKYD
jgi:long-subunit fatty acid transport protein